MARRNRHRGGSAAAQAAPAPEAQSVTKADVAQVSVKELEGQSEQDTVHYGQPFKYEPKQARAAEAKVDFDPTWGKRDAKFTKGRNIPKGDKSVFGQLRILVAQNEGITGAKLAVVLRYNKFPNPVRSKYLFDPVTKRPVIPAIGWAEGYIDGAVTKQYLSMIREPGQETDGRKRKAGEAKGEQPPEPKPEKEPDQTYPDDEVDPTEDTEEGEPGGKTGESHPERSPTGATPESREVNEAGEYGAGEGGEAS